MEELSPIPSPTPEAISVAQQPKFSRIRLIIFGVIAIVILACLGTTGYYIAGQRNHLEKKSKTSSIPTPTPSANLTATWKTYTDTKYHFSIKYPEDYADPKIQTYPSTFGNSGYQVYIAGGKTHMTSNGAVVNNPQESYGDALRIEVYDNSNQLSSTDYIQKIAFANDLTGWNNIDQPRTIVHLSNNDAVRIEHLIGGGGDYGPVAFIADGKLMIEVESANPSKTNQAVFDLALPTFTFSYTPTSTPTPISSNSNTKYSDKYFGYSISYPNIWYFRRTYGPDISKLAPTDILSGFDLTYNTTNNGQITTQATIVMNMLDRHNMQDIQSWIAQYDLNYPKDATKSDSTFNGLPAIKYSQFTESNHPTEVIYFLSGKYAYRITAVEQAGISDATRTVVNSFHP